MRLSIIALLIFCGSLFAQPISSDTVYQASELEDVVITAQYAPTHYKNAVHEVRVLKAENIRKQGFNNLAEVLTNELNLRVSNDLILGSGLNIQGIGGQNIQILIDGIPMIGRVGGDIDLSQVLLANVERIEIIEGAMSAQYGSNASGGVINIITKKSQLEKVRVQAENQYETLGIWNNSLTLSSRLDRLFISVTGSRFDSQFAPDDSLRIYETQTLNNGTTIRAKKNPWNPKEQYGIEGKVRFNITDSLTIGYGYRHFDEELRLLGEVRRPTFRPYHIDEILNTIRSDHSFQLEGYLGKNWYLNSTTGYNNFERSSYSERLDIELDSAYVVPAGNDTSTFTALLQRSMLSTAFNGKWNGQIGLEYLRETGTGGRIVDSTSAGFNETELENHALWGSINFSPTQELNLMASLRWGNNSKFDHPLIPSFHLLWKPVANTQIRASYAQGFRAPDIKELHFNFIDINHYIIGNPELEAENSENITTSVEFTESLSDVSSFTAKARFFYNNITNRIVLAAFEPSKFNYQNIDTYETHGVNLQLSYQLADRFTLKSGFAHTRLLNQFADSYDSDRFVGLSEMQNELQFNIPTINTRLILTHRFIGKQIQFFVNEADQLQEGFVGDYHLINATLSKNFWQDRILLVVGGKNLLDTTDVSFVGQGGAHSTVGDSQLINVGRSFFVRLGLSFGAL
ncbi:MAG: TonB-dependent receptor [Bacteroidota bacterium]